MKGRRFPIIVVIIIFVGQAAALFAEGLPPTTFFPLRPRTMAQGGSSAGDWGAFSSLFSNPAGLAFGGSVTLPATALWVHSRPARALDVFGSLFGPDRSGGGRNDRIAREFEHNGVGVGGSTGIGFIAGGLGLGLLVAADSYLSGTYPNELSGWVEAEFSFVGGYAVPVDVGFAKLAFGVDLRPIVKIFAPADSVSAVELVSTYLGLPAGGTGIDPLSTMQAANGTGIAVDAGVIADFGAAAVELAVRDIFNTRIRYTTNPLDEVVEALGKGGLPAVGGRTPEDAFIDRTVRLGFSFNPDLGELSTLLDPRLHFEIDDLVGMTNAWSKDPRRAVVHTHAGLELNLADVFALRAGLNQGHPTAGAGLRVLIFDLSFAVFTRELGEWPGDNPVSGVSVEAAIQF